MVANSGTGDLVILSAVADGGFTVTTALPVTVKPGAQVALVVAPPAAVIGTDRGGGTKDGMLILTTNEAASEHTVELTANVLGANLAFTDEAGAAVVLAFSAAFPACPAPKTVFLRNTGTSALVLGEASASGLVAFGAFSGAFSGFSGGTLEPGAFATQDIRPIADVVCTGSGMVTYQVTGTVCTVAQPVLVGAYNISGASGSSCFCS
jgi:hypothetical protein